MHYASMKENAYKDPLNRIFNDYEIWQMFEPFQIVPFGTIARFECEGVDGMGKCWVESCLCRLKQALQMSGRENIP